MTAWLLGGLALVAVHRVLVRRPFPARVPSAPDQGPDDDASRPPRRSRSLSRAGWTAPVRSVPPPDDGGHLDTRSSRSGSAWDLVACCDLLAVAASAGCSLRQAVDAVGAAGRGPVAAALARAGQDMDRGAPLDRAVHAVIDRTGDSARPLISTLVVAAGAGTPVAPALQRLADGERRRARRAVEARVRRLPVLLLIPLVVCILPAFVMMTLVPVGIAASRSLAVPGTGVPPP